LDPPGLAVVRELEKGVLDLDQVVQDSKHGIITLGSIAQFVRADFGARCKDLTVGPFVVCREHCQDFHQNLDSVKRCLTSITAKRHFYKF